MKRILLFATLLMLPILQVQALIIGTTENSPPLAYLADGHNHFLGFEIEIMQAICQRIKTSCDFKAVVVNSMPDALTAHKIDLAIAAITIPPEPINGFLFSIPYLASNMQFIAKQSSQINSLNDLTNKTVGVRRGKLSPNFYKNFVLKVFHNNVKVIVYRTTHEMIGALHADDVDAVLTYSDTANYWIDNIDNENKLIGKKLALGDGYGIMSTSEQSDLIEKINQALRTMMNDGSYLAIYSRYF